MSKKTVYLSGGAIRKVDDIRRVRVPFPSFSAVVEECIQAYEAPELREIGREAEARVEDDHQVYTQEFVDGLSPRAYEEYAALMESLGEVPLEQG